MTALHDVRKKLIEVSIPLEAINKASKKQKAPKGYPTSLHKYWAQRPISACRAILFTQLVDDPSSWPDRFKTIAAQETERKRLHKVIADLVPWDASNDEAVLNAARWEIARSVAWGLGEEPPAMGNGAAILAYLQAKAPPVYDPFSGAGSIPLESQRLGLRAFGSDLNPVAVLISKALVEIPPKFADQPPVNPIARAEAVNGQLRGWKGAQGLAEDVRYYGHWMRDQAERRIGHFYPKVKLSDDTEATAIAYFWARTVRSPDPTAKGAMVPLVSSFMLSTGEGKKAWAEPVLDPRVRDGYRFEVLNGTLSRPAEKKLSEGTKVGRATFRCVLTGATIGGGYIDDEAQAGRMSARLMAVVAEGTRSRAYRSPTAGDEAAADSAGKYVAAHRDEMDLPRQECRGTFASNAQGRRYCFANFSDYFTSRQLIALATFSDLVTEAREQVLADARAARLTDDPTPLYRSGTGPAAYADAVATYLAFVIDRAADFGSSISTWLTDDNAIRGTYARQAIQMTWDFCEANYFGDSSAALRTIIKTISNVIEKQETSIPAHISQSDAAKNGYPVEQCVINTDPPYYNNMEYADLSDFFFVWLRRTLAEIWPDLFRLLLTPKAEELVASTYRHGQQTEAEQFFMRGMGKALTGMGKASSNNYPLVIYYAFKQSEASGDGIMSAGWASFLQAVAEAGLTVDGTWPLRTESGGRIISLGANALASSIVLVCRKRDPTAAVVERDTFVRALRHELPDALAQIRVGGVGPVDMAQAAIGPGMGVFTRYAAVLEDSGEPMKVRAALAIINQTRDEIDTDDDASYDLETRFALDWFSEAGWDVKESGRAILAANARNLSLDGLIHTGLITTQAGKARLIRRDEMSVGFDAAFDRARIVWKAAQYLARALTTEDGGQDKAAAIMAHLTGRETIRALAYRLYGLCERKNWSAEALIWNRVAEEWRAIEDRAATMPRAAVSEGDLFGEVR
jgi:putative DNA methylase